MLSDIFQKSRLYWGIVKAQSYKRPIPLIANLFITGRCNAKCSYCYVEIDNSPNREFTLEQWKQIIDDLYDRGTRMFALVGGEPLLHPDIDELVDYIARKNVFLNLTTNGFLIHEHLEAAQKATEVSISLDGDTASHNKNRGMMSFERSVRGIDYAVENGVKVRLCTVVTAHNFDQIDFLLKFAEERNIFISFTPLIDTPVSRREAADDLRLSDELIRDFFNKLKEAKKHSLRIINSFANMEYMINYPVKYGEIIWKEGPNADYYTQPCPYGRFQYLITNVGEVYPCAIMWNNNYYRSQNIFDDGIDAALSKASQNLKCQCCSFANAVDWNSIVSMPWLLYGIRMTLRQFWGGDKNMRRPA